MGLPKHPTEGPCWVTSLAPSLLGDKTRWHHPGEGTYLSVQGPLRCPHASKPLGHPKFELKPPLPSRPASPPPPQPARLYDAAAGPSLGRDFQKLYLYMHSQRSGCTGCIYTVLDARVARRGRGPGGSPAAERAHDTHSHRARERGQGTMRRGWGDGGGGSGAGADAHLGKRTRKATWEQ